jgi:hypothetical protein
VSNSAGSVTSSVAALNLIIPPLPGYLSQLSIKNTNFNPIFSYDTFSYSVVLPNSQSSITINAISTEEMSVIKIDNKSTSLGVASLIMPLNVGSVTVTVSVQSADSLTTRSYVIQITRLPSSNSSLAALALSSGALSPSFTSGTFDYTASVANTVSSVAVTPTAANSFATVQVNGIVITSGTTSQSMPLNVGSNTITVRCTAQDGTTVSTYSIIVTRAFSSISTLETLLLSAGTLSPSFAPNTFSYNASVANNVAAVAVTPTAANIFATIHVNGSVVTSGKASQNIPLNVGSNTISVLVTAQNGITTTAYTIMIMRISNVSTLSALALSSGSLAPSFTTNILNYTATVANATTEITVTPTSTNSFATVRVNGTTVSSGTASQSIPLDVGSNIITLRSMAQDGATSSTYTLVVTRVSNDSTLSALTLSRGSLSPSFSSNTLSYTMIVNNTVSAISVTPTASNGFAAVQVNGSVVASGTASQSIPLDLGSNKITVSGTSQDGTSTSTYTIVITRLLSDVSTLSSLELSSGTLSPSFESSILNYTTSVPMAATSITLTPTLTSPLATVKVNGTNVASGSVSDSIPLTFGSNTITIVGLAQDGTSTTAYTLTVMKYQLSLVNQGNALGGTFSMTWNANDVATLIATPQPGYLFGSWTGDAFGSSNPSTLLMNSDKTVGATFVEDARDSDGDGITNYQEIVLHLTDPNVPDSDADGLSDTYELVYKGTVEAFAPRIGDRLRFELRELVPQGTLRLVGRLPSGLTFNAVTGVLEGKLTGRAGAVNLSIQVLSGTKIIRSIPFTFTIAAFPSGLIGTWEVLLLDANGELQGMISTTIKSPGTWSAWYDAPGTSSVRSAKGTLDLTPSMERAAFSVNFPVVYLTPSFPTSWQIDATTALASGTYAQGTLRGFRLAKTGELPTVSRSVTMVIDQGEQDGFQIPAGLGWATGTLSTRGSLALTGQLGDAQAFRKTVNLGATGQAILWVKPYRNKSSFIGGVISLHDTGVVPQTPFASTESGLRWQRMADSAELSYSSGFGPIGANVMVSPHLRPASALALATNLGLANNQFNNLIFDGGGLPNAEQFAALPQRFVMDTSYKLNSVALPDRVMALWQGSINSSAGTFTGTIALDASNSGILKGNASVSGVVFRRNDVNTVGAGLIKIPTTGVKGSFRTGAFLMDR